MKAIKFIFKLVALTLLWKVAYLIKPDLAAPAVLICVVVWILKVISDKRFNRKNPHLNK